MWPMAKKIIFGALALALVTSLIAMSACSSGGGTAGPPGDSTVTGQARAIHKNTSGYPYEVAFLVVSSDDVDTLPNPTKDKVGTELTAETNEDIHWVAPGEKFTANVKWAYDSSKPVPIFYIYNIKEAR